MKVGGTVQNTLKGGGTEKRGGDTKILKRMGQAGAGTPLGTMAHCLAILSEICSSQSKF